MPPNGTIVDWMSTTPFLISGGIEVNWFAYICLM